MTASNALVLGSSGFLGQHVTAALLRDGWKVRGFDRRPAAVRVPDSSAFEVLQGEFDDLAAVAAALDGCDTVFHLISTTLPESSNRNVAYDLESNVAPMLRFLDLAVDKRVGRVVFASSGGTVYGPAQVTPVPETHATDPRCAYGIHKLMIEKYLALYRASSGLDYRVLRIANAFGEGQPQHTNQGAVVTFLNRAIRNEPIVIWGDGTVVRDYIHVEDVARAFIRVARHDGPHTIFNIGTGSGTSLLSLLEVIETLLGRPLVRQHLAGRTFDVPMNVLDIGRAREWLNWQPEISFVDGVRRTLVWLMTQPVAIVAASA